MKKLLLCALVVLMLVPLSVFAGGGRDQARPGQYRVAVALSPANNAWHIRMREVIDEAIARHPDIHWNVQNATDLHNQQHMLEVFRAGRYDVLIVIPMDGVLLSPIIEAIYNDGTRTIVLNRAIVGQNFNAFITGDNFGGGVNAARLLGERLGGQGNIAVLRSMTGTPIDMDRYLGFSTTLAREFPNIRVIAQADGEFNREAGLRAMTSILPAHPHIDAVFAQDDETALGALVAIENAGRTDIRYITGFGGVRAAYDLLLANNPRYLASMSYFPTMGFDAVEMAVRMLRGVPYPRNTVIVSEVVTAQNVRQFLNDAY